MRILTQSIVLTLAFTLLGGTPAEASALCKGKPRIALSDGSRACILDKKLTTITRTRSVEDTGPATQLQSKENGALVVLNFVKEPSATSLSKRTLNARAKGLCQQFRDEFLSQVNRPGDPFMAVVLTWGTRPTSEFGNTDTWMEFYFSKNCWARREG